MAASISVSCCTGVMRVISEALPVVWGITFFSATGPHVLTWPSALVTKIPWATFVSHNDLSYLAHNSTLHYLILSAALRKSCSPEYHFCPVGALLQSMLVFPLNSVVEYLAVATFCYVRTQRVLRKVSVCTSYLCLYLDRKKRLVCLFFFIDIILN